MLYKKYKITIALASIFDLAIRGSFVGVDKEIAKLRSSKNNWRRVTWQDCSHCQMFLMNRQDLCFVPLTG